MITKPYDDEFMTYNKIKHRYILTTKYLQDVLGVDIEARLSSHSTVNATVVTQSMLDNVSSEVYNYLYMHNNTKTIQWLVAKCESARNIIMEAMGKQALYTIYNGDLGFSSKKDEQDVALNKYARDILDNQEVIETGTTLTYIGAYPFTAPLYTEGDY